MIPYSVERVIGAGAWVRGPGVEVYVETVAVAEALARAATTAAAAERARCTALVRTAGCQCFNLSDSRAVVWPAALTAHDPHCPIALAARIEAGEEATDV